MGKQLYSDSRQDFRELLKLVRTEAGLSQGELSQMVGRPQSFVSDYERAHRRLDFVTVAELVEACGVDLVDFAHRYQTLRRTRHKG